MYIRYFYLNIKLKMKLKKSQIEAVATAINYPIKNFSDARKRDVFMKSLQEQFKLFTEQQQAIYTEFCEKDEEGKPSLIEENKYQFKNEVLPDLDKELGTLYNEEIEVQGDIKDIIINSQAELKTGMTDILQEVLDNEKENTN